MNLAEFAKKILGLKLSWHQKQFMKAAKDGKKFSLIPQRRFHDPMLEMSLYTMMLEKELQGEKVRVATPNGFMTLKQYAKKKGYPYRQRGVRNESKAEVLATNALKKAHQAVGGETNV